MYLEYMSLLKTNNQSILIESVNLSDAFVRITYTEMERTETEKITIIKISQIKQIGVEENYGKTESGYHRYRLSYRHFA